MSTDTSLCGTNMPKSSRKSSRRARRKSLRNSTWLTQSLRIATPSIYPKTTKNCSCSMLLFPKDSSTVPYKLECDIFLGLHWDPLRPSLLKNSRLSLEPKLMLLMNMLPIWRISPLRPYRDILGIYVIILFRKTLKKLPQSSIIWSLMLSSASTLLKKKTCLLPCKVNLSIEYKRI